MNRVALKYANNVRKVPMWPREISALDEGAKQVVNVGQ